MPEADRAPVDRESFQPNGPGHGVEAAGGVIEAATGLVETVVAYVRQETGDVVHDKVVVPTQRAGQVVAFALAAAGVMVLGVGFISAGVLALLAQLVGWPFALLIVGAVLMLVTGVLTYAKLKRSQDVG